MMAAKLLKQAKVRSGKSREAAHEPARAPAAAVVIARSIEEDIVLGRRQPRERLVEQDLSDIFRTHRGDVRLARHGIAAPALIISCAPCKFRLQGDHAYDTNMITASR